MLGVLKILFFVSVSYLFFLTSSCKKDLDSVSPEIVVISPYENASYVSGDSVLVSAEIKDNEKLTIVSVRLLHENLQPALPHKNFEVSGNSYKLNNLYVLSYINMISGIYYLRILASDGINESKKYIKLNISALPFKREGIVLVSSVGNIIDIYKLDEQLNAGYIKSLTSDYSSSSVNSTAQKIFVLGKCITGLNKISIQDGSTELMENSICSPPIPYFNNMYQKDGVNYLCYYSGLVKGFDVNGAVKYSSVTENGFYPVNVYVHEEYVLNLESEVNGTNKRLSSYYKFSGAIKQTTPVLFDVVDYGSFTNDKVLLFINEQGHGKIRIFTLPDNAHKGVVSTLDAGLIKNVTAVSSTTYLIAHDKMIYKYNASSDNLTSFNNIQGVEKIEYDFVKNEVLAVSGKTINVYDYLSGNFKYSFTHNSNINNIHLLYNR